MQIAKNKVCLYNTQDEIESRSAPYAIEDAAELERVISRFFVLGRKIAMYPDVAVKVSTGYIQLASDLRAAVNASRENHRYPNIVLPVSKYFSAKVLWVISQSIGPEIAEMIG